MFYQYLQSELSATCVAENVFFMCASDTMRSLEQDYMQYLHFDLPGTEYLPQTALDALQYTQPRIQIGCALFGRAHDTLVAALDAYTRHIAKAQQHLEQTGTDLVHKPPAYSSNAEPATVFAHRIQQLSQTRTASSCIYTQHPHPLSLPEYETIALSENFRAHAAAGKAAARVLTTFLGHLYRAPCLFVFDATSITKAVASATQIVAILQHYLVFFRTASADLEAIGRARATFVSNQVIKVEEI